ncbi:hypothetical protein BCT04_15245 [Vibrio breoganii]|uniref:hypothetical protein n=1 Tax=Vibrio breoganii TaxID=553239 RepID=UPI000C853254|nr:hypothetical protein [Vibrio breoganii]PMG05180.1 hypothetical protein BCV00_13430 [Vibrio breoganii]PMK30714.1 hypothetical protein BCU03_08790 [Vibrio breoganii]PMO63704.1 hypothetical protein BCT04_15245 [Vibrio breoganii]
MKVLTHLVTAVSIAASALFVAPVAAENSETNSYIFEAIATPEVFGSLVKAPQDRGPSAVVLLKEAGCEMTGYYQGVHNLKTYILADCNKDADIAALMFTLYGSGAQSAGNMQATQVISTKGMMESGKNAQKIISKYAPPKK